MTSIVNVIRTGRIKHCHTVEFFFKWTTPYIYVYVTVLSVCCLKCLILKRFHVWLSNRYCFRLLISCWGLRVYLNRSWYSENTKSMCCRHLPCLFIICVLCHFSLVHEIRPPQYFIGRLSMLHHNRICSQSRSTLLFDATRRCAHLRLSREKT